MVNFVFPEEITYFIESLRPFSIKEVGSSKWLETHEMIIKLSQQAVLEAAEHREEEVKEFLISRDKLKVLIHEAFCILLWKTRVLPYLLETDPNPHATFFIYTVLFHEAAVVSLLDTSLFHSSGCEVLQDTSLDLIDYCAQGVAQLIGLVSMGYLESDAKVDVDESVLTEMERQKRDIIYKIGLRCISLLSYLANNTQSLPTSAARRMVVTHDVPWLMVDLLCFRPWQRRTNKGLQKYIDEKWTIVQNEEVAKVIKPEAQAWFCLRQLLFNPKIMESYPLHGERCEHLGKALGMLHETVLDQLPPLIELKQFLSRMTICKDSGSKNDKNNLLLEEIPEIREELIKQSDRDGGFIQIAQQQESIFLNNDNEKITEVAQRLSNAYSTDLLAEFEQNIAEAEKVNEPNTDPSTESDGKGQKCANCLGKAEKKCANCKISYYCSRKCQLDDWPQHKKTCIKN